MAKRAARKSDHDDAGRKDSLIEKMGKAYGASDSLIAIFERHASKYWSTDSGDKEYPSFVEGMFDIYPQQELAQRRELQTAFIKLSVVIASIEGSESDLYRKIARRLDDLSAMLINEKIQQTHDVGLELPERAPACYVPRKSGKASDFLKEHWGAYIQAGVMFRPDLRRLDPKLEVALANEFRGRSDELRALLPIKSDEVDARIERELGAPIRPENRKAAIAAVSFSKYAKTQK